MFDLRKISALTGLRPSLSLGVLAVAAGLLAGCATDPNQPYGAYAGVTFVPAGEEQIAFDVPAFAGVTAKRVRYVDEWEREEYALYRGAGGARAEVVLVNAERYGEPPQPGDTTVLDFDLMTDQTVRTWNMAATAGLSFGETVPYKGKLHYYLAPFTRKDTGQGCFGFHAEWNWDNWDHFGNGYDSHMFGYYCAPAGTTLDKEAMATIIDKLDIIGVTKPAAVADRVGKKAGWSVPTPPHSAAAMALVQKGVDGKGRTGNAGFPFEMARQYEVLGDGAARN